MAARRTSAVAAFVDGARRRCSTSWPRCRWHGRPGSSELRHDVILEAFNLACGFLDADGLPHRRRAVGAHRRLRPPPRQRLGGATPVDVRKAGLVDRPAGLARPSRPCCSTSSSTPTGRAGTRPRPHLLRRGRWRSPSRIASLDVAHVRRPSSARHRTLPRDRCSQAHRRARRARPPAQRRRPRRRPAGGARTAAARRSRRRARSTSCSPSSTPSSASTPVKREVKLVTNLIRVQQLRRERGPARARPEPPPRLHRQPGHGQDHGRSAAGRRSTAPSASSSRATWSRPTARGLVAGFVGQTATKVVAVFDRADEGVLLDRRGLRPRARRRERLRPRGDRHDRQAGRGPARPGRRHRRRLPRRDGRARRRQPRAAVAVPEDDPLPRLHRRRAAARSSSRWARRAATPATRRRRAKVQAWLDAQPRDQGVRQRPAGPQPVRGRRRPPGQPARRARVTDRRPALHPDGPDIPDPAPADPETTT